MIYCVEDDQSIRELILYSLKSAGYQAKGFETGEAFFQEIEKQQPDAILLDIMLPGQDGIAILTKLRQKPKTHAVPVIMLTAKTSEFDKVNGLNLGADDYVTKPFGVMELLARVNAVLRRSAPVREVVACGKLELDLQKRTVLADGKSCTLTFKEFELLHYLMVNQGLVMSRDKIMSAVWECDFELESRTVDMHIKSLRHKLEECGVSGYIKTVRSIGYLLDAGEDGIK